MCLLFVHSELGQKPGILRSISGCFEDEQAIFGKHILVWFELLCKFEKWRMKTLCVGQTSYRFVIIYVLLPTNSAYGPCTSRHCHRKDICAVKYLAHSQRNQTPGWWKQKRKESSAQPCYAKLCLKIDSIKLRFSRCWYDLPPNVWGECLQELLLNIFSNEGH